MAVERTFGLGSGAWAKRLLGKSWARPAKLRSNHRLGLEVLETRQLLSITDMTALARLFPPHAGATTLWLNFDGGTVNYNERTETISAFESRPGANRNQDIQTILSRTAEILAPFNVLVQRTVGAGNFDSSSNGNTTIFIGADTNDQNSNGKYAAGFAPAEFEDTPNQ